MSRPVQISYAALAVARVEEQALGLRADAARGTASALTVPSGALGRLVPAAEITVEAEAHRQAALADLGALHDLFVELAAALHHAADGLADADDDGAARLSGLGAGL